MQHFKDFEAAYEEFRVAIPSRLNGAQNYAKISERKNQDQNYIEKGLCNRVSEAYKCHEYVYWFLLNGLIGFLLIGFFLYLTYFDPYSFEEDQIYKIPLKTKEYGIQFYVKSGFDHKYPVGSSQRAELENNVITEYIEIERHECSLDLWWHSQDPTLTTPDCDKLKRMGIPLEG
ncbi:chaperone protein dnaJ 49 [Artemisia annua]|uniref:Chaperone protein dnaJ 49 n=1 Tax=Artemisia annua TaxID=35608 RepID=A0A2U1LM95_ARTAN|nr:chaperone protein dnaJ 49 [Artemisia annua]